MAFSGNFNHAAVKPASATDSGTVVAGLKFWRDGASNGFAVGVNVGVVTRVGTSVMA